MSFELKSLKQRITELEAENTELRKENTEIPYLRNKLSVSDSEIAKLKRSNIEFLRANEEYNERRDAENAKLRAGIEELKSENAGLRDRVTKVEQKQMLDDNTPNDNTPNDNTPNNNSSNFNSGADQLPMLTHHEKPLVDDTSLPEEPIPEVLPEISASNNNVDIKPSEDKKMESFLDGEYKKK